jgi:Nnf1
VAPINEEKGFGTRFPFQHEISSSTRPLFRCHGRVNKRLARRMMASTDPPAAQQTTSPPTTQQGKRATALRTVLSRSLEKTIQTCSYPLPKAPQTTALSGQYSNSFWDRYEKVAQSFPTISAKAPDQLKFALDESLSFLKSQVLASFEEIIVERQAVARLNELDTLIDDAKTRKQKGDSPMQKYTNSPPLWEVGPNG